MPCFSAISIVFYTHLGTIAQHLIIFIKGYNGFCYQFVIKAIVHRYPESIINPFTLRPYFFSAYVIRVIPADKVYAFPGSTFISYFKRIFRLPSQINTWINSNSSAIGFIFDILSIKCNFLNVHFYTIQPNGIGCGVEGCKCE